MQCLAIARHNGTLPGVLAIIQLRPGAFFANLSQLFWTTVVSLCLVKTKHFWLNKWNKYAHFVLLVRSGSLDLIWGFGWRSDNIQCKKKYAKNTFSQHCRCVSVIPKDPSQHWQSNIYHHVLLKQAPGACSSRVKDRTIETDISPDV